MKKIIQTLLIAVGLSTSFAASAAGTNITSDAILQTDCTLLGEQVTLNLSTNVFGAWKCDEALSSIQIGTCHKAGSRKARTIQCRVVGVDDIGGNIYNMTSCSGAVTDVDVVENVTAYNAYIASSSGGSVAPTPLDGNCTDANVAKLAFFD